MARITIANGRVVTPEGTVEADLLFDDESGMVEGASRAGESTGGGEVIDATGKLVFPGLVDCHVHLRDPGATHKEDFLTGTTAALAGGVTTVIDMPNNNPAITTIELLEQKMKIAAANAVCDYSFHFGAAPNHADEIRKAAAHPAVAGLKIFIGPTTAAEAIDEDSFVEAIAAFGERKPCCIHAEDAKTIEFYARKTHEAFGNNVTAEVHNKVRPPIAAELAVQRVLALSDGKRVHLHFCHTTTAKEIEMITQARLSGAHVTCEATPHHLFLTEEDAARLGNYGKMNPPLRGIEDASALWHALVEGKIDCVATDHAPHARQEKEHGYWEAPAGVPGLETMLPLLVDQALKGKIPLERIAALTSANPAKIFSLKHKGRLDKGKDADVVIVDPDAETVVDDGELMTKCGWSPFAGMTLKGRIEAVFLRGRQVCNGKVVVAQPGSGKLAELA